jgi:hypothetical protein
MTRRSRIAALVAVVALAAAAGCSNNDANEGDVVSAMEDAGLTTDQAECVGTRMQDEFGNNQELFNDVAGASDIDELPEDTEPTIRTILDDCLAGEGADDTTDTTEAGGDESTDTTEAGETTTTTAAG